MSLESKEVSYKREVKTYMLRSRMTLKQEQGLEQYWPLYGVDVPINSLEVLNNLFPSVAPIILEIGFGMGNSLIHMAKSNPSLNFLGIEVHKPGVGSLLSMLKELRLTNLRVIRADALKILNDQLPDNSLYGVQLFFPDPWPKRRHHKRRMVQPSFVDLIYQKLQPNGYFHLATDVEDYASHIHHVITNYQSFSIMNGYGDLPECLKRLKTKFELRGERLGHRITDLLYRK